MVWYRWYSNTTPQQTTVTENTTTTSSYIRSRSSNMNQPVYSTTTNTTNHSNDNHNKKYRSINYHLLSQSKVRQQHLLRCYVRTNNLKRIQDYYQSIQNYYYHTQQVLERTQQQRIQCPSNRRQQRKKRNRNRNSEIPDDEADEEDSIYIRIDCGGGGGGSMENENDDDDDSSCLPDEENHDPDTVFVSPLNHNRNRDDIAEADSIVDDPPLSPPPPPLSELRNSTNNNNVNRMTTAMLPLNHLDTNEYDFFAGASNAVASPNNNNNNNTGTAVMMMSPVYTMLDIDASINPNETLNWTILYYACFHHQYDIVKYLIEECYASMKCTDRYHNTILHWICHYPLPIPTPPTVTLVDQDMASGNNSHSNKTKTTTRKIQRFMNYYHHRSQPPGHVNNDPNLKNIVLLLQYIMECAPTLILVCNNYKELPIHWLCQYGNNNLILIQCMIQFIQTNPYFTTNQNTVTTNTSNNHRSETETTTTTRGSSSSSLRRLLYQEDQYHRTPMDVARLYHNDDIAQYLQSLLL